MLHGQEAHLSATMDDNTDEDDDGDADDADDDTLAAGDVLTEEAGYVAMQGELEEGA